LFSISDLEEVPLLHDVMSGVRAEYPDIADRYLIQETKRDMIGVMVDDVMAETRKRLAEISPESPDDIRMAGKPVVAFSPEMHEKVKVLKGFLYKRMYKHYTINRIGVKVERIIGDLFKAFHKNYMLLPDNWQRRIEESGALENEQLRARIVADYIAGMTDRYAIREHERLFDLYWDLR